MHQHYCGAHDDYWEHDDAWCRLAYRAVYCPPCMAHARQINDEESARRQSRSM